MKTLHYLIFFALILINDYTISSKVKSKLRSKAKQALECRSNKTILFRLFEYFELAQKGKIFDFM